MVTIQQAVNKGVPYGREKWVDAMVAKHHLETTFSTKTRVVYRYEFYAKVEKYKIIKPRRFC